MKFKQKVTAGNIFRYKNRMFITIFGLAGAASILFSGFSVKGSIYKINEKQFEHIIKYDMIVDQNDDDFNQYISLADRKSQEKIELQDDGIVISERLAKLLKVSKCDEITFTDSSNKERTAKVSGIINVAYNWCNCGFDNWNISSYLYIGCSSTSRSYV